MATEREWAARNLAEAEDRYERCARDYSELCTAFHERGGRIKDLEKSLADAKAEGRREAIEEVRRMIRRWEMAREQAGASEIRNVYADYLSAGDVILAAIDALAKEGR